jgi:lysophospholipase L1-like esterase
MKRRVLQLSVAILSAALTLEIGLQVASWVSQRRLAAEEAIGEGGEPIRILCVGDSHTYGQGVERHETYPAQLEVELQKRYPEIEFQVLNLGIRGVNAAYVAKRLEAQILRLEPALVIVWVGTNNMWNYLEAGEGGTEGAAASAHRAMLHVKLYRLGVVLWHTRGDAFEPLTNPDTPDRQRAERKGAYAAWLEQGKERSAEKVERSLSADIRRIVAVANAMDTPVLFTTYPQRRQNLPVSDIIEATSTELGVPVVVTAHDRARALDAGLRDVQLFVFSAGPHPSAVMYRYIVDSMIPHVTRALGLDGRPNARAGRS